MSATAGHVPDAIGTDIKQCPDCAETVKFEARVCRFCGRAFGNRRSPGVGTATVVVAAVLVGGFALLDGLFNLLG